MKLEVNSKETANELESNISNNVVCIVLYHMNGCMYCETMIPEWYKFANKYESNKNIVIATIEREYLNLLNNKPDIMGYPTIYKYTKVQCTYMCTVTNTIHLFALLPCFIGGVRC
jgi:thiol-disulfide isomerase/thioredoxin